jgi:hypothetical protein
LFNTRIRAVEAGRIFSTSVTPAADFYLTGKKENGRLLPKRRISVRPLFAEN